MSTSPREDLIEHYLRTSMEKREWAVADYNHALEYALQAGWSNVRIAKTVGMTEAAIRQWRKRHGL